MDNIAEFDMPMEVEPKVEEKKEEVKTVAKVTKKRMGRPPGAKKKTGFILRNVLGEEVPEADYFYKGVVPPGFEGTCGNPVDREELVEVFHKVFKPKDNILFYKQSDKEVYIVIIPIKYSTSIGDFNDSLDGDFQKHAISFLNEGSVNLDTMRLKLERINKFVNYSSR